MADSSNGRLKQQRLGESGSLWNQSFTPGWTPFDLCLLRYGLMKFGFSEWRQIQSVLLPNKTAAQIVLQTQRMIGQQSLAEFSTLRIDPLRVGLVNRMKRGAGVVRKNGIIINIGDNRSVEEIERKKAENAEAVGVTPQESAMLPDAVQYLTTLRAIQRNQMVHRNHVTCINSHLPPERKRLKYMLLKHKLEHIDLGMNKDSMGDAELKSLVTQVMNKHDVNQPKSLNTVVWEDQEAVYAAWSTRATARQRSKGLPLPRDTDVNKAIAAEFSNIRQPAWFARRSAIERMIAYEIDVGRVHRHSKKS